MHNKHISSRENNIYKSLIKLSQGKERSSATAMLEGIHLCQECIKAGVRPQYVLFNEQKLNQSAELQQIARKVDKRLIRTIESRLLKNISKIAENQGVLFIIETINQSIPAKIDKTCLWLDQIQDPGNVGNILRTAAAAGVSQVYLSEGCAQVWSTRVLRSAQGAHFYLELYESVNLQQEVQNLNIPLYAAALNKKAANLYDLNLAAHCAWLFGNEGSGASPELLALASQCVFIPHSDNIESLNVATATAICLFEQRRQLALTG